VIADLAQFHVDLDVATVLLALDLGSASRQLLVGLGTDLGGGNLRFALGEFDDVGGVIGGDTAALASEKPRQRKACAGARERRDCEGPSV